MVAAVDIEIPVRVYDQQYTFINDTSRYPAFIAGRNSGKTVAGAKKAVMRCNEPGLGVVAAPTFPMLEHAAKRAFMRELDQAVSFAPQLAYVQHKSTKTIYLPTTGAEVMFASLDNPDSVRGPNFDWGWLDEPGYVTEEGWKTLKGGVRAGDHPQLWTTGTPKGRQHFLYREWMVDPDQEHTFHHATSHLNPFADPDYVAAMNYQGDFYAQEIGGEFVAFEGLVYPGFSRNQVHMVDTDGWNTGLALDVGTNNPTALLTFHYGSDRIHQLRELYQRGLGATDIVDLAVAEYHRVGAEWIVCDPSAAGIITDLESRGLRVRKAQNAVVEGIARMTSALPTITIDPSCVFTIAEYESYQYPLNGTKDIPLKANDHAMDASRYFVMEVTAGQRMVSVAPQGMAQRSDWR